MAAQQFALTPQALPESQQTVAPTVAAGFTRAAPVLGAGGSTDALLAGLASVNPALHQYTNIQMDRAAAQSEAAGRLAASTVGKEALDPTSPTATTPDAVAPAWGANWQHGYRAAIGERMAIQGKQDMLAEYQDQKMVPGFDVNAFNAKWQKQQYAGVTDPLILQSIANHHEEASVMMNQDYQQIQQKQTKQYAAEAVAQVMSDRLTADMTPEQIASASRDVWKSVEPMGRMTRPEYSEMLMDHVIGMSEKAGGAPELFKALTDYRDPDTGLSFLSMNPKNATELATRMHQAEGQRYKRLKDAGIEDGTQYRMGIQDRLRSSPASITDQELMDNLSSRRNPERFLDEAQVLAIRNQRDRALETKDEDIEAQKLIAAGQGWALSPVRQKAAIELATGNAQQMMLNLLQSKDPAALSNPRTGIAPIAANLVNAHQRSGVNVPNEMVKSMFTSVGTQAVAKDAPPPSQFLAAAELYRALPDNLRTDYTDKDSKQVMSEYVKQTAAGVDPQAAYQTAYNTISPEAKRAAEQLANSPDFKLKMDKLAQSAVTGAHSWVPFSQAFGLSPKNDVAVGTELTAEAISFMTRNPSSSDSDRDAYLADFAAKNYVMDKTSGNAIRVPQGMGGQQMQEAISAATAKLAVANRVADRKDGNYTVTIIPKNLDQGTYLPMLMRNGSPISSAGPEVTAQGMVKQHVADATLTDDDRKNLSTVQAKLSSGAASVEDLSAYSQTLAKSRALGLLDGDTQKQLENLRDTAFRNRLATQPQMALGAPSANNLMDISKPVKVDNTLTSSVANGFLSQPSANLNPNPTGPYQSSGYRNQAAALITMGESVMLRAYPDPAKGAGNNIGMGYNLDANVKNRSADLKAAGVPVEQLDAVIGGKAALTQEQASRLLQVSLPRYETSARVAVDKLDPTLWDRTTTAQKAVLIDVAYQVGTPEKFPTALKALMSGDGTAFNDALKVHYTDRQGNFVEDTRRNNLRSHMLAGSFNNVVNEVGSKPATKLAALTSK